MASNNRSRLSQVLSNRRSLIIISVILALITWLAISINESPVVERTIKDVRVQVDESLPKQLGYQAFGADDLRVDVTVSGRRYEIGDNVLSASDIRVVAVTSYVDAPGKYTLQLRASSKKSNADFKIVSKSQDYVDVYFDTPKTTEIELEPVVRRSNPILYSKEYMTEGPVLSRNKLTLYGPQTQIDRLAHAYAIVNTDGMLRHSETQVANLAFVDDKGQPVTYLTNMSPNHVTLTIPVYQKTNMPLSVEFSNVPTAYLKNLPSFSISPSNINIAVDPSKLRDLETISLGTIDFSRLAPGINSFTFHSSDIVDGKPLNNDQTFTVTVKVGEMAQKELSVDLRGMTIRNGPAGFRYAGPKNTAITLTLYGPKKDLDRITAKDIQVVADLRSRDIVAGANDVPLRIVVNSNTCWSFGTHTAVVTAVKQ